MRDRRTQLKVKIKYLAEEARIIKREEEKARDSALRDSLYRHRIDVVRDEARHSLLAYGLIRGREYAEMEGSTRKSPDFDRVEKLARRFGPVRERSGPEYEETRGEFSRRLSEFEERVRRWIDDAEDHVESCLIK